MTTFLAGLVSLLNKIAPWVMVGLAFLKGQSSAYEKVDKKNLEKELEYAKIDAAKPDTIDDDIERLRNSSF